MHRQLYLIGGGDVNSCRSIPCLVRTRPPVVGGRFCYNTCTMEQDSAPQVMTIGRLHVANRVVAYAALILCTVIWGSSFVVTKVAVQEMPPFTLAFLRFTVSVAIMLPLARRHARPLDPTAKMPWRELAVMGLSGITLHFALFNLGLVYTTATNTALIQAAMPVAVVLGSAWFLKERLGCLRALGAIASIVGVVAIVLATPRVEAGSGSLLGDALIVGTVFVWVAYTVVGKMVSGRISGMGMTIIVNCFGAVFLIPFFAYELLTLGLHGYSTMAWLVVLYLAIAPSSIGYFLWNFSLAYVPASQAGVFMNVMPVVAVIAAVAFLGEAAAASQLFGAALVFAGVYAASR
jgi:drug/metabolite transporter (DMT)-like permease